MTFRVVLLLGLVALAWGQSVDTQEVGEAEPVCSKVMCRMFCPFGFYHSKNDCPVCKCLPDPCHEFPCAENEKCTRIRGQEHPKCIPDTPCPMPMCTNKCDAELGYKNNEAGCMTCECNEKPLNSPLCANHPCPDKHHCVAVKLPLCQMLGRDFCDEKAMCLPDKHNEMFLPHLPEHVPSELPELKDIPEVLKSVCEFRQGFGKKLAEETKIKYSNHSMLGRILQHQAMHVPWCTDDGKFRAMQCHAPDRACWCVNDRGIPVPGSRVEEIKSKGDLPKCMQHVTQMIEGSFLVQHGLDDVEPHLTKIASLLKDHMAKWLQVDHAQIIIKQVSKSSAGMIEVHFSLHRTDENELHSAQLMLGWHLGKDHCNLPYEGTILRPQHKTLQLEHYTDVIDGEGNEAKLPDHGLWMREKNPHYGHHRHHKQEGFMALYHRNKVAVICGGVGIIIFAVFFIAVVVTVVKRGKVTSGQFKHKRMSDKSKTYKENLAFANEVYTKQAEKPGLEITEEKTAEEKPETDA